MHELLSRLIRLIQINLLKILIFLFNLKNFLIYEKSKMIQNIFNL